MGSLRWGEAPLYGVPIREDPRYGDPPLQTDPGLWGAPVKEDPPVTGRPFPAQRTPAQGCPPGARVRGWVRGPPVHPSTHQPFPTSQVGTEGS